MVKSLFCARDAFDWPGGLVVAYGDIVYEPRVLQALLDTEGDIVVTVDRSWLPLWQMRFEDPLSDAESLAINAGGHITDIGRVVSSKSEVDAQYIGLMRFSEAGTAAICDFYDNARDGEAWLLGKSLNECYMTDLLRGIIETGVDVRAAPIDGGWLEFDTTHDLETYERRIVNPGFDRFFNPGNWG